MGIKERLVSFYKKNRKIILLVLRLAISITLIIILIKTQLKDLDLAVETLKSASKSLLLLAFFTHLVGIWITAERWRILLRTQNIGLGIGTLSVTVLIGFFFSNFLPTTIGGDFYRIYDSSKRAGTTVEKAASVILVERLSGVVSAATYAIIALFLGFTAIGEQSVIIPIVIFFAISIIVGFFIINPSVLRLNRLVDRVRFLQKIRERLKNIYDTLKTFKKFKLVLLLALFYSFALQFMVILNYYFAARSLGIGLGLVVYIFIVPVVAVIAMLPISIGGIGLRENSLVFILVAMGVINEKAALFSLIIFAMWIALGALGGIAYIIRPFFEKNTNQNINNKEGEEKTD
jgi:glycosyltransferase 2 family protein